MANWARLQEQLTGLPVVKRARHGIHFDKGNGEIVANFSGAPCHYEDKGVWKPIDTTLLLGADGFYGCPHSPVKVHKDGRVKVDKSHYSQFTDLPGSPIGKVDGNRIVREFPGGRQYLYVTEDGFREEIVVDKPTFPLEKFICKTSGTLPSAYKASPQTAVDANGDVFEITSDTKAFGDWLDGAVYPVTIDPDFNAASGGGRLYSHQQLTYADARNNYYSYGNNAIWIGQAYANPYYSVNRTAIQYDTSSIPDDATITQANISITTYSYGWNAGVDFIADVVKHTWTGNFYSDENFDAILSADFEAVLLDSADITGGTFTCVSDNLDTTRINKTGTTQYGFIGENDRNNIAPTGNEFLYFESAKLTVTYTAGSTGALRITNMNAQMSNLTGGMHG